MKKKVLFIVSAIVLAISVSALVYVKNESDTMNQFFDANVEALAENEGGFGLGRMCSQTGTPGSYNLYLCSTCRHLGQYAFDYLAYCK